MTDPLSSTVKFSMKVNLGNYESADVFLSVSNLTQETTPEEIRELLQGSVANAYSLVKETVEIRAKALKPSAKKVVGAEVVAPPLVTWKGMTLEQWQRRYWTAVIAALGHEHRHLFATRGIESQTADVACRYSPKTGNVAGQIAHTNVIQALLGRRPSSPPTAEEYQLCGDELFRLRDEAGVAK